MMADGYDDCEGDILARARAVIGDKIPLGVILDLHANLTTTRTDSATMVIGCKEYPHTDYRERVGELYDLLERTARGEISPRSVLRRGPAGRADRHDGRANARLRRRPDRARGAGTAFCPCR